MNAPWLVIGIWPRYSLWKFVGYLKIRLVFVVIWLTVEILVSMLISSYGNLLKTLCVSIVLWTLSDVTWQNRWLSISFNCCEMPFVNWDANKSLNCFYCFIVCMKWKPLTIHWQSSCCSSQTEGLLMKTIITCTKKRIYALFVVQRSRTYERMSFLESIASRTLSLFL